MLFGVFSGFRHSLINQANAGIVSENNSATSILPDTGFFVLFHVHAASKKKYKANVRTFKSIALIKNSCLHSL